MTPAEGSRERRPRLLHVTTAPQTLGFLHGQVGFMREAGLDVCVLSSPGAELRRFATAEAVWAWGVPMARRIAPASDVRAIVGLARQLRDVRPEIVHAHTPKAGLLTMLAAWLVRVPVRIYHVHGFPFATTTGWRRRVLVGAERIACRLAHRVLCVSRSVRELAVEERIVPAEKIVVPAAGSINGIDAAARFDPAALDPARVRAFCAAYGIEDGAPVVGFVGRLVPDKGVETMVRAWDEVVRAMPEAHLVLAGEVETDHPLPAAVREALRRAPRTHLAGHVDDMPAFYGAIDVLAFPTLREGLGLAPLEAASMQCPCVASRVPGCVDAVEDGVTGTLVPPRDPAALAAGILRYLQDRSLSRAHGLAGRERVLREFDPRRVWEATLAEYRALLDAPPQPSPALKRALDLALALPALVLLAPVLGVVAVAIAAAMGRPVVFRQPRIGRGERTFTLYKFRTMRDAHDAAGRPLGDGERLTPLGRFLRRTSLDELPSLWNVVRGDMSLVGPRPLLLRYGPWFTARERARFSVPPGITGWSQIHGRNEARWDERLERDVWYVEHRTLGLDLRILAATLGRVVRGSGVVVDPGAAMADLDVERAAAVRADVAPEPR